jgi:hypothetical protein
MYNGIGWTRYRDTECQYDRGSVKKHAGGLFRINFRRHVAWHQLDHSS